jgi:hypothetical protein
VYGSLGLLQALAAVVASLLLYLSTLAGAKALHSKTLLCLMHCPMAFFDTTPQGRIMNRFSKGRPLSPCPVLCFTHPDRGGIKLSTKMRKIMKNYVRKSRLPYIVELDDVITQPKKYEANLRFKMSDIFA